MSQFLLYLCIKRTFEYTRLTIRDARVETKDSPLLTLEKTTAVAVCKNTQGQETPRRRRRLLLFSACVVEKKAYRLSWLFPK